MVINEFNPQITENIPMEKELNKAQEPKEAKAASSGDAGPVFAEKIRKIISTTVEYNQGLSGRKQKKNLSHAEQKAAIQEENLKILKNTLSPEVLKALKGEEKNLQEMTPQELVKAVIRIRKQNVEKQELSAEQAEKKDAREEAALEAAVKSGDAGDFTVMQAIDAMNLPMDEELAGQIMLAASMAVECQNITDSQRVFMVKEDSFTIRKLYESGHAGEINPQNAAEDLKKAFEEVKFQVEKLLNEMGLGKTGNNGDMAPAEDVSEKGTVFTGNIYSTGVSHQQALDYAEFLFENQLPLTKENINKLICLDRFSEMGVGEIMEEILYQTSMGTIPEKTDLSLTHLQAEKEVGKFKMTLDISSITAKRQLEEIRIKLTVESGYRLMKQGISMDISHMQQIIDGLKQIENEYYENILREEGAEADSTQVEKLRETAAALDYLKNAPADVLGASFSYRFSMTIERLVTDSEDILKENYSAKALTVEEAARQYETLGTAPRADLGDSIKKAFKNVPELLTSLDMEASEENQRAVRILGRCHMEITRDSVEKMKMYDSQVNHLLENLHPAVAARIIKEGFDPMEIPVYELNQKIDKMRQEMGIAGEESYSSYLWNLEHTEGISAQERGGYIGLFRLLHQIQSEDRAAIGNVVESGKEMTLSNLLTAVRTRKGGSFDQSLDIDFQGLSSLTYESSSITAQISSAFSNNPGQLDNGSEPYKEHDWTKEEEMTSYFQQMVEDILSKMEPGKIAQLLSRENTGLKENNPQGGKGSSMSFMDIPLEQLYAQITGSKEAQSGKDNPALAEEIKEELKAYKNLMENSGEEIRFLNSLNQPVTLANLYAANILQNGSRAFFRSLLKMPENNKENKEALEESAESILDEADNEESLSHAVEEFTGLAKKAADAKMYSETITGRYLRELRGMNITADFISGLKNERHYEIPVLTEKGITGVSLTVMPGKQEGGRVRIVMEDILNGIPQADSSEISQGNTLVAEFSLRRGQVNGFIASDRKETAAILEENRETIEGSLMENQVEIGQIQIGSHAIGSTSIEQNPEKADTGVLYQLAKSYIKAVIHLQ